MAGEDDEELKIIEERADSSSQQSGHTGSLSGGGGLARSRMSSIHLSAMESMIKKAGGYEDLLIQRNMAVGLVMNDYFGGNGEASQGKK